MGGETTGAIQTDYLVAGPGVAGMAVTDALLTHTSASITLVDRRHAPGGHWRCAIVMLRYVPLQGQLRRVISVVKVRGSEHSKHIRFYDIDKSGIEIDEAQVSYDSILSGRPLNGSP